MEKNIDSSRVAWYTKNTSSSIIPLPSGGGFFILFFS